MANHNIKLSQTRLVGQMAASIERLIQANQKSEESKFVQEFEAEICNYVGVSNGCALSSGTAALHLGLKVLGVQKGDTVLCSSFTFAASAFPITYLGAKPVFIDAEATSWNLCPVLLEKTIEQEIARGQKPAAILVVHSYGIPAKMNELVALSNKHRIPILEDAAEALGARYRGKSVGTFGDLAVFSFNANKVITTLGGGMLVGESKQLIEQARILASQAKQDTPHYEHLEVGYNYNMSPLAAATGLSQIASIDTEIQKRKKVFNYYKKALKTFQQIHFLEGNTEQQSNYWMCCILTPSYEFRERLRLRFEANGIESRPLWKPMHLQPVFQNEKAFCNGISDELFQKGLCLPSSSHLTNHELKRIVDCVTNELDAM